METTIEIEFRNKLLTNRTETTKFNNNGDNPRIKNKQYNNNKIRNERKSIEQKHSRTN
jgi:hypothetical protein